MFTKSCILFVYSFYVKKIQFPVELLQVYCKKYKIYSIWWAEWMPVFDG